MNAQVVAGPLHGAGLTDVRMMVVAHRVFRRELGLGPAAVARVPPGDRAGLVRAADHVALFLGFLHHHHTIEDELLWPRLLERVPDELAPLVHLMESQHEELATLLEEADADLATWRGSGLRGHRDALAATLTRLATGLAEHLDCEESRVLPIMARVVTPAEWEEFTERGMEAIPRSMTLLGFGAMLYEGDPEVIAGELRSMPRPLRWVLPALGRWSYRRYARRVHGTARPPRGTPA